MKNNYYYIFQKKLYEAEVRAEIENESTLEKILRKSKKVTSILSKLITSQKEYGEKAKEEIREIVSDIRFISYKPTTFRIVLKNGNFFDLKYDPTPLQLKNPEDYTPMDSFIALVSGKKYNLANRSEMEQSLDYINTLLKTNPILREPEPIEEPGEEPIPPEGGEATPPEEEKPEEPK